MNIDCSNPTDLLRWWHQYQAQILQHEADLIRNGFLQEMVAIRRRFEMSCHTHIQGERFDCEMHLADLSRLYALLENLSNRLDFPYLEDSLPLALQYIAQIWQAKFCIKLHLPSTWVPDPREHSRLLVMLWEAFLQQMVELDDLPHNCQVKLHQELETKYLIIQAHFKDPLPLDLVNETSQMLEPFLETFQLFTQGKYCQDIQRQSLTWDLSWKLDS